MGLFGKIGGAIKGAVGAGGGNKGGGGGFKQAMQQRGIGPSAPPPGPPQEMPPVPVGNQGPPQGADMGPGGFGGGGMMQPHVVRQPPSEGGFKQMLMQRQAEMGQNPQESQMSVPQGQFNSWNPMARAGQMGQMPPNFAQAFSQMYGQAGPQMGQPQQTPPFAGPTSAMGRGAQKMGQMGLGPSQNMGARPMPMGQGFGQGTGNRMQPQMNPAMRPQMGGQRPVR